MSKTAHKMGPQIHELAIFFIKRTPFEFGFCVENNFKIGHFWADWQTPQYVQNGPQYGAQNTRVGIFFIPLRAKRVGEFIENGHKKISPTRIGSGRMDGWMDGWMDGKAGLRIAYSNQKCQLLYFRPHIVGRFGQIGGSANRPRIVQF